MKKVVFGVFIASIAIISGCSNNTTYTNDSYNFSLTLPNNYKVEERGFGKGTVTGLLDNYGILKVDSDPVNGDDECGIYVYTLGSNIEKTQNAFENSKNIGNYVVLINGIKDPCEYIFNTLK